MMKCELCSGKGKINTIGHMQASCYKCNGIGTVSEIPKAKFELTEKHTTENSSTFLADLAEVEEKVVKRRGRPAKR